MAKTTNQELKAGVWTKIDDGAEYIEIPNDGAVYWYLGSVEPAVPHTAYGEQPIVKGASVEMHVKSDRDRTIVLSELT